MKKEILELFNNCYITFDTEDNAIYFNNKSIGNVSYLAEYCIQHNIIHIRYDIHNFFNKQYNYKYFEKTFKQTLKKYLNINKLTIDV